MLGARLQMGFGGFFFFIRKYLAIINSFIHFIEVSLVTQTLCLARGLCRSPYTLTVGTQRSGDHKARKGGGKLEAWKKV